MKLFIYLYLLIIPLLSLNAQNFYLQLTGSNAKENIVIDSLDYISIHKNIKSITDEIEKTNTKLNSIGYIESVKSSIRIVNDSTYSCRFALGKQIKYIHIYIGTLLNFDTSIIKSQKDSITIPYTHLNDFLNTILQKTEQKGYALAKFNLIDIQKKKDYLAAKLNFDIGGSRKVNEITAKFIDDRKNKILPTGHLKQLNSKYKNQTFNKNTIDQIYVDVQKYRFVNQIKYPEILFLQDTTKIYIYLEKRKSNNFDGYIGFNTDNNSKLIFNGYLDLTLENTIKAGEQFSLFWKSNGNDQKIFTTNLEIPYIFNSNIGLKGEINILKQDSTFQNTKTAISLGYLINYNSRIHTGLQFTESSDIQNSNSATIQDYKNSYFTFSYDYINNDYERKLFPTKSSLLFQTGFGKRKNLDLNNEIQSNDQLYAEVKASYTFELNKKNYLYFNSQTYFLKSTTYLTNELHRFGGTATIRGFAENSFQAKFASTLLTEYRYVLSSDLYLHSIIDYALFEDPSQIESELEYLTGIGFGFGLVTKTGLLHLTFANGIQKNQKTDLSNSVISLNYNINF
ncbi:BamA/TamA family outer membrane protein [Flavobacterium algicola]|uniref:hypothetical protein n=1 Tax=Flavobacterium algicola TaxID=556529 RepID=UPI001EFDEBCB|nr:hypothetical protein [Flavobacterium algicola]MCG9793982.1 hypothetical protein [Flavobacterium algicola]